MPNRKKFEYLEKVITVEWKLQQAQPPQWDAAKLLVTQLDELGEEGWDLVHIEEHPVLPGRSFYTTIFKREKITDYDSDNR
jgi:hypothetical protein